MSKELNIVLICGGRGWPATQEQRRQMKVALEDLHRERPFDIIITGGAEGADRMADFWAKTDGIQRVIVPANWEGQGISAGPKRNALMLKLLEPNLIVAFPGGRGTDDMVGRARQEGLHVVEPIPQWTEPT